MFPLVRFFFFCSLSGFGKCVMCLSYFQNTLLSRFAWFSSRFVLLLRSFMTPDGSSRQETVELQLQPEFAEHNNELRKRRWMVHVHTLAARTHSLLLLLPRCVCVCHDMSTSLHPQLLLKAVFVPFLF